MLIFCILCSSLLLLTGCLSSPDFIPPVFQQPPKKQIEINNVLKKRIEEMNFYEAVYATAYYKACNDLDLQIKAAERVLALYGEEGLMRQTMLELIEALIERTHFEKAQRYAEEYELLYPGASDCKQARYLGIRAYYLDTHHPERDQSKTEKTIEQIARFVDYYPDDTEFLLDVQEMKQDCYEKLMRSEVAIAQSCLAKYRHFKNPQSYRAAQKRVEYIKDEFLHHLPKSKTRTVIARIEAELNRLHDEELEKQLDNLCVDPEERIQMLMKNQKTLLQKEPDNVHIV